MAAMAAAGALALSAGSAFADATVSQNPADGADFDTINAALAFVGAGETVTVLDNAVYAENVVNLDERHLVATWGATIQGRIVLEGAGEASLKGFMIQPNFGQQDAVLTQSGGTFLLEDLVFVAETFDGFFSRDGIRITDPASVTVRNVELDGFPSTGITALGGASGFSLVLEDVVIVGGSNCMSFVRPGTVDIADTQVSGSNSDAVVLNPNNPPLTVAWNGGGISDSGREGVFIGDPVVLEMTGVTIQNSNRDGIRINGPNCVVTLVDCIVQGSSGDGIFCRPPGAGSVVTVEGGTFTGNDRGINTGGAITVNLRDGAQIVGNSNIGIAFVGQSAGSTGDFRDSVVADNGANGLALHRSGDYLLENMLVEGNAGNGVNRDFTGGDTIDSTLVVRDSIVRNNGIHGVVAIADGGNIALTVEDCLIEGNGDRCIWVDDKFFANSASGRTTAAIQRNVLVNNSKAVGPDPEDPEGPDVILSWGWNTYLWNPAPGSLFANNVVDQGYAGMFINRGSVDVHHNTIVNNRSDTDALIFVDGGDPVPTAGIAIANILAGETVDIRNNIIANAGIGVRTALEPGFDGNPPSASSIDGTLVVDFNLTFARPGGTELEAGLPGVGLENILGADPAFIAPSDTAGAGNYSIFGGSPAVNAGTDLGFDEDILGNPRPLEGVPDMGAYEVMSDPSTVGDWSLHAY